jgi:hypothetical protein
MAEGEIADLEPNRASVTVIENRATVSFSSARICIHACLVR